MCAASPPSWPGCRATKAEHRLLDTSVNPFNRTALHRLELDPAPAANAEAEFVCSVCHGRLKDMDCYLLCRGCQRLYFRYEGIPVLDPADSHNVTCLLRQPAGRPDA